MSSLLRKRTLWMVTAGVVLFVALGVGQVAVERSVAAQAEGLTWGPMFEVDPLWPKPLPNHWVVGATIGVAVDERDHVWIVHRESTLNAGEIEASADPQVAVDCCVAAPPVLEFDQAGTLVGYWGGRARVTNGRSRTTGWRLTTRATCGSGATTARMPMC